MIKKNERGIAIIEYALLLALVAVAVYAALDWTALLTNIQNIIDAIVAKLV